MAKFTQTVANIDANIDIKQIQTSSFENRWLVRLSDRKARQLRGLESHPKVRAAFDSLLVLSSVLIHRTHIGPLAQR